MIHKTHMTIDAYLRQAGIKTSPPENQKTFIALKRMSDARFNDVLDGVSPSDKKGTGDHKKGATIADYLSRQPSSTAAAFFSRSTLHSNALSGFCPDRRVGPPYAFQQALVPEATVRDSSKVKCATDLDDSTDIGASIGNSIAKAADTYNLSAELIASIIRAESNFQPDAVSPAGAQGLMQLMPATARELGVTDPFDVQQNIDGGARYIRQMLDRFGGDVKLALAAYNAGPGTVERYDGDVPYRETRNYVEAGPCRNGLEEPVNGLIGRFHWLQASDHAA